MKKILSIIFLVVIFFIAILLIKTLFFTAPSNQFEITTSAEIALDSEKVSEHLANAIRFQTISHQDSTQFDSAPFLNYHKYLEKIFPHVQKTLKKEILNQYSLLYTWRGKDETLKPILLMAHQDVVPVEQENQNQWIQPPFEGKIADGFIWGRGALDVKCGLLGILEAVELLLQNGFQSERTVYLSFGHDEEIGGTLGAVKIAELFRSRNISFEFVLDEGGVIIDGIIPGVSKSVALVGIAEKGYLTLELNVEREGGHSSIPPRHTAVGILSEAIVVLENHPFPPNMKFASQLFQYVGPGMPFFQKMIFANNWLTSPLIERKLSELPAMNANIRTTTAATVFKGGDKENVLPPQATAVINFRIMPGESIASVIEYVRKTINNSQVKINPLGIPSDPPPVADMHSRNYNLIKQTIYQTSASEPLIVAPFLVIATTDSRHFIELSENVYRFIPIVLKQGDLNRVHGVNERISINNYQQIVKFYYQLIKNFGDNYGMAYPTRSLDRPCNAYRS